jgi:hypothetical protein
MKYNKKILPPSPPPSPRLPLTFLSYISVFLLFRATGPGRDFAHSPAKPGKEDSNGQEKEAYWLYKSNGNLCIISVEQLEQLSKSTM